MQVARSAKLWVPHEKCGFLSISLLLIIAFEVIPTIRFLCWRASETCVVRALFWAKNLINLERVSYSKTNVFFLRNNKRKKLDFGAEAFYVIMYALGNAYIT